MRIINKLFRVQKKLLKGNSTDSAISFFSNVDDQLQKQAIPSNESRLGNFLKLYSNLPFIYYFIKIRPHTKMIKV